MAKPSADTISNDTLQAPQKQKQVFGNGNSFMPKTEQINHIFKLSNDKRKGKVFIDVEEDVIDPATGQQRRMRLLRGAKSIWMDEQPPTVFPEKYVAKNILSLEFENGVMIINANEPLKLQAALHTNCNEKVRKNAGIYAKHKPYYFYEWNPVEQNEKAIAEEDAVIKAMQLAMTATVEEMVPHAHYLKIEFADEMGVAFDESALRAAYIRRAKNQPAKFLNSIHSPTVKIAFMIKKAMDKGLIDLGTQVGAAYWTDGGFISTLPEGRDSSDYLIEFAMTHGDANVAFMNQLKELTS